MSKIYLSAMLYNFIVVQMLNTLKRKQEKVAPPSLGFLKEKPFS